MKESELSETNLFIELSLLQPNWFSALVSKAQFKPTVKLNRLEDLIDNLKTLSLKDPNTTACVKNWVHRSRGFLHWHTLFRANWHYNKNPDKEFIIFRDMNKVQSRKTSLRNVKFENDVHVSVKHIGGDIKVMRELHDKKELEKDVGALSSLTPVNISLLLISDSKKQMDNENTSSFTDGKEGFIIPINNCII